MKAAVTHNSPSGQACMAMSAPTKPTQACAVRLTDRRIGLAHRVNGSPLTLFTRNPSKSIAKLLRGRDASVLEVRAKPIGAPA